MPTVPSPLVGEGGASAPGGPPLGIQPEEYERRRLAVYAGMEAMKLDALCVFYPARIAYLTGFHHIPTERPIALVLGPDGHTALVVPAVEKEHAEQIAGIDRLDVYFEYPGAAHPMERLSVALAGVGARGERVGADHDGYLPIWGYRGPKLSELTDNQPIDAEMLIESLRRVKSPDEIACIQLSCDWAVRAHRRMQDAIVTGRTEMECYAPAAVTTLAEMVREMPGWRPVGFGGTGLSAMFVAGRSTHMPHGFVKGQGVRKGDVLVSGAAADIDGYQSELERTMIVDHPTPAQERTFAHMLALQTLAIQTIAPGVPVAEVELEVIRLAHELGVRELLRHHVGHSIGLEAHEAPFLDRGDEAILEEGMVLTVEPGIYLPELGGFRHSDTVLVTEEGSRVMTGYPRELRDLVVKST